MGETDVLRGYWHPVARVSDIGAGPYAATVLDQRIVLYRSAPDEITAFEDLCMHRGSALSLGWVDDGNITCRYHGWSYDSSGMCVRIPTLAEGRRIPEKARLKKYGTTQRYGLVWVALEDPIQPVPDYPAFDNGELATMLYEPFRWQANAARIVENVLDYSHLPWVHEGMLGDREQPVYADVSPEILADGLTYELFDGTNDTTRHYRLFLPFTVLLSVTSHSPEGRNYSMLFACCPVNNQDTIQWFFTSRDSPHAIGRSCSLRTTGKRSTRPSWIRTRTSWRVNDPRNCRSTSRKSSISVGRMPGPSPIVECCATSVSNGIAERRYPIGQRADSGIRRPQNATSREPRIGSRGCSFLCRSSGVGGRRAGT